MSYRHHQMRDTFACPVCGLRRASIELVSGESIRPVTATFYLALTNQLGIKNRSFVMDATHDAEVWNFAVVSYKSTYFNPQTFHQTDDIKRAIVPINQFTVDNSNTFALPAQHMLLVLQWTLLT